MAILIAPTQALLDKIACTPDLENGVGPVVLGVPLELADGRLACCHPWSEVTIDWLTGYVQGISGAEVLETDVLPYALKQSETP